MYVRYWTEYAGIHYLPDNVAYRKPSNPTLEKITHQPSIYFYSDFRSLDPRPNHCLFRFVESQRTWVHRATSFIFDFRVRGGGRGGGRRRATAPATRASGFRFSVSRFFENETPRRKKKSSKARTSHLNLESDPGVPGWLSTKHYLNIRSHRLPFSIKTSSTPRHHRSKPPPSKKGEGGRGRGRGGGDA